MMNPLWLEWQREKATAEGKKIVLANGCFDLLHAGHLSLLEEAKAQGDILIVAVTCDEQVREQKGEGRPIVPQWDRVRCLQAVRWVDHVVLQFDPTPEEIAKILRPDVLVKGEEYDGTKIPGAEFSGRVHLARMLAGRSTTGISAARPQPVHSGPPE